MSDQDAPPKPQVFSYLYEVRNYFVFVSLQSD